MRFAQLFVVRLLTPALVLVYVLAMLASSCLPVADATGEVQAIPRWEYWLLHASVPSAIWWQWTGGLQPIVITDRIPILMAAAGWILVCMWMGKLFCRFDPLSKQLSKYERIGVSILVGQSALSILVFLHGTLFGTASLVWLLMTVLVLAVFQWRLKSNREPAVQVTVNDDDTSFVNSMSRRMVGLLFLAAAYLASVQVYGATLPTQDMDVREVDWWIIKHAALEGRIAWTKEHPIANAPAGFDMPSVFFASLMTCDLSSVASHWPASLDQREHWNRRLKTSVLAGKTVNAMLCLVGILLAAVHLGQRWGYLVGLFVAVMLLSTPGIAELTRLGRTDALIGIWGVALIVVWQGWMDLRTVKSPQGLLWGSLLAGAFSCGYGSAVLVGLPALAAGLASRRAYPRVHANSSRSISTRVLFVIVLVAASSFYLRNAVVSGDPISPWGTVLVQQIGAAEPSNLSNALMYARRIPYETIQESMDAASFEGTSSSSVEVKSPYRFANLIDGTLRLLGNSNVHGLMLIPLALVGCFVRKSKINVLVLGWIVYWLAIWWGLSVRQDRDWVGALFFLAWPCAIGANWIKSQARGYFMFLLVSIAIVWSVVVIPIWPTSDNRILVALNSIDSGVNTLTRSKAADGYATPVGTYAGQFNAVLKRSDRTNLPTKVLLIGENDDFDLLAECVSNGAFGESLLDECSDLTSKERVAAFRIRGISHLLVVWTGVRYRENLTGQSRETKYRSTLAKMLRESHLQSIPWEMNSSQAELFLVNED